MNSFDADYWANRAKTYNDIPWVHDSESLRWTVKSALYRSAARPNTPIGTALDIGCGTGAFSHALACDGLGFRVVAVDTSQDMIDNAKPSPFVTYKHVDDAKEAAVPGGYDLVSARMVLHHTINPTAAVADWLGLAAPQGRLVIIEGVPPVGVSGRSFELFHRAMLLKEPGRHVFLSSDIGDMMLRAGAAEIAVFERFTYGNSCRKWLTGSGLDPDLVEQIMQLHREAQPDVQSEYAMKLTDDGDVLMRWRQAVVVGLLP